MKKNFGKSGRFVRVVFGTSLIILGFTDFFTDELLQNIAIGIGIFLLLTALVYFCPLYYFLGINTFKSGKKSKMY
ncbi:YgaP family membrane protein [Flavobacterium sp. 3HN19-14]|uniref:YgaP family membrane protein n=1 Tax=Flavobacterium sp. 3HN19-14 TaxID=3448133 RepID=UPI003EE01B7C